MSRSAVLFQSLTEKEKSLMLVHLNQMIFLLRDRKIIFLEIIKFQASEYVSYVSQQMYREYNSWVTLCLEGGAECCAMLCCASLMCWLRSKLAHFLVTVKAAKTAGLQQSTRPCISFSKAHLPYGLLLFGIWPLQITVKWLCRFSDN